MTANLSSVDHSDGLTFIIYTIQSDMGGGHLVSGYRLRWSNYTTEACLNGGMSHCHMSEQSEDSVLCSRQEADRRL